ncbi:hypothetical protein NEOLI_004488 [Neolecta irregularis DAH-3]|uniref:Transcription factor domain-containing protein n=1 Tax=Neolecta irregularis (strain DAH-3) TaxID=1198029 RepID=A0A1U7LLN4_NEOID|nr:hypothetical protein NEOLI_004488 [Neolecta irregularis DAH-3]|eukprot:OLL23576.1 hypothetical protein NEOLI_004488 [Neolecta irregularis DAH-3]
MRCMQTTLDQKLMYSGNAWSEGLPLHIRDVDTDCKFPNYDPAFDQGHILARPSLEWSIHLFGYTIRLLAQTVAAIYSIKGPNPIKIAEIDKLFDEIDAEKPNWLTVDPTTTSHSQFFRQIATESCLARFLLYIHLPFQHNRAYPRSRGRAVEAAQRSMRVFCQFDDRPFEDLQMYRWFGEVWMISTPLLATLVLSMDLVSSRSHDSKSWELVERTEAALLRAPELTMVPASERVMNAIRQLVNERSNHDCAPGLAVPRIPKDLVGCSFMEKYVDPEKPNSLE